MTAQLEQILNYLDREGVTEVILAAGQPMQFRRSGALVSITAAQLTRVQVAALVANTPLSSLLGQKSTVDLQHGKRALRVAAMGTPEAPVLSISKQPPAPAVKPAPAVAPIVTERARRPSRLLRSDRAKTPSSPPPTRTRGSSKAPPAATPMPDTARDLRSASTPAAPTNSTRDPRSAADPRDVRAASPEATTSRGRDARSAASTPMSDPRGSSPAPRESPEPAPAGNRLTKSDIKFKTPAPRARDPRESLPLDLEPGGGPPLEPPLVDLGARTPAPLSLELDDSDDGIELGPGGHQGSTPAIDRAFGGPSSPHPGSTPAIDRAFGGPSSPHTGSTPAIDDAFGGRTNPGARGAKHDVDGMRTPHAGSTPAIDDAFGGPARGARPASPDLAISMRSPHAGSTPAIDDAFGGPARGARPANPDLEISMRSPHAGSTPAIDDAFGGPRGKQPGRSKADSDLEIEIDVGTDRPGSGVDLGLPLGPRDRPAAWSLAGSTPLLDDRGTGPVHRPQNVAAFDQAFGGAPPDLDSLGPRVSTTDPPSVRAPAPAQPVPTKAPIAQRSSVTLPPALRALLQEAAARRASDLHVIVNRPVCVRVLSELVPLRNEVLKASDVEALLLPLLDDRGRAQLANAGYSDLAIEITPGGNRLRTNISRCQGGLRGTFRIARAVPPTLDELGLQKELAKVVAHHQGLVVISGPSGHGKTTTLAALVDLINSASAHHIITVEDPIEIVYPRKAAVVSQREVGAHTKSFAAALKGSLREDPDVIVIGELRDRETVEIALTAAETGHLVFATMSTPSAAKTIDRLVDMFPPDDQSQVRASIAGALRAIVSQRLLPSAKGDGVVAAIELVTGVLPLATMIRDDKLFQLPSLMQRGRAFGMIRLDDSLAELVRANRITSEVALAAAENRKELAVRLSQGTAAIPTMGRKP